MTAAPAPLLLQPYDVAGVTLRNRIVIAPMCQYMAVEGMPLDWHLVQLGRFAIGGAGLVFCEATAIEPRGRISHGCTGIWNDDQARMWARISDFLKANGAASGMQLAHAGRKASTRRPWEGGGPVTDIERAKGEPAWETVGPSAIPFGDWPSPHALTTAEMAEMLVAWRDAAQRTLDAGFDVLEIHGAHGYLIHSFLSPLSNHRIDAYGGDLEGRMRFPLEVVETVRAVWPKDRPLFMRISATEWTEGGWSVDDSVVLARALKERGVDVVHCSTGGNVPVAPPVGPGYQVPFSDQVRREAGIPTVAVGAIMTPEQAEDILEAGQADLIAIARAAIGDPNWPMRARETLAPDMAFDAWPFNVRYILTAREKLMKTSGLL